MSVRTGARSALVVAVAGAIALVTILLFLGGFGDAFGRVGDVAVLVMTLALAPVMATWYELGGRTPLRPAQASLASAVAAVLVFAAVQLLYVSGLVTFDLEAAATGAFAVEAITVVVIGLWIGGASVLAGPWLTTGLRWFGAVTGAGVVLYAVGLLLGGVTHPLTYLGGVGYQVLLPIWAFLLYRRWRDLAAP
jgi:hypothetical protein